MYYASQHGDGQTYTRSAADDVGDYDGLADSRKPPCFDA
jgi:hypothetical protein